MRFSADYSRFGYAIAGAYGFQAPYPIPEETADARMVVELKASAITTTQGTIKCFEALGHQQYRVE